MVGSHTQGAVLRCPVRPVLMGFLFMCKPCMEEYYRFFEHKIPGFVECARTATVTDELIAKLRACDMSADERDDRKRTDAVHQGEELRELLVLADRRRQRQHSEHG